MIRNRDDLPADVQDMLGTTGRPVRDQLDYLQQQFNRHPAAGTLHLMSGRQVSVPQDGIVSMTVEDSKPLVAIGWLNCNNPDIYDVILLEPLVWIR